MRHLIIDITDPEGRPLVPARSRDAFNHKPVWAAYKIHSSCSSAESRRSDFVYLAKAQAAADALNRSRGAGVTYYFKVYRLAAPNM